MLLLIEEHLERSGYPVESVLSWWLDLGREGAKVNSVL